MTLREPKKSVVKALQPLFQFKLRFFPGPGVDLPTNASDIEHLFDVCEDLRFYADARNVIVPSGVLAERGNAERAFPRGSLAAPQQPLKYALHWRLCSSSTATNPPIWGGASGGQTLVAPRKRHRPPCWCLD